MNKRNQIQSDWANNIETTNRVKELLETAGIPLELNVMKICSTFSSKHRAEKKTVSEKGYLTIKGIHVDSEKVIYDSNSDENEYREVDCKVQIYEEFEVEKPLGIQLSIQIPIECKFRKDIEIFGFPSIQKTSNDHCFRFPMSSDLAKSNYFRSLATSYKHLSSLKSCHIALIEIKDGKRPQKISDEQLIYKAASSLYDFIYFDLAERNDSENSHDPTIDMLLKKFNGYLKINHYAWWSVLREWMKNNINKEYVEQFNKATYGKDRIYHSFNAYFPIICINGRLFTAETNSDLKINNFHEDSRLLTQIRKRGWPGKITNSILLRTPEVSVMITNPSGLYKTLELGYIWYENIKKILTSASPETIKRCPIEAAFTKKVVDYFQNFEGSIKYRSDLDFTNWY